MVAGEREARQSPTAVRPAEPGVDPLIGTVVDGRFRIVERIARGGMANVYFATQSPLNRPVALKVVRVLRDPDGESEENFRRRFLQEASILAQLPHPNIVMLFDYGQIHDLPGEHYFMAMEYLRGETLAQRFRSRGRMSIDASIRLARQIGRGLREAHRRGFVHRDLKPSNIMLIPEDDHGDLVKLVDFGIGKIVSGRQDSSRDSNEDMTRVGLLLGSPRYMSPEQIRSEPVESRTDLYGLGVILFQALTGRLPFEGRTEVEVLIAHCSLQPPSLAEACPDQHFPESLAHLIRSLLQKEAARRPTVDEFLQQLANIEEELFGNVGLAGPTLQSSAPRLIVRDRSKPAPWDPRSSFTPPTLQGTPNPIGLGPTSIPPHSYVAVTPKRGTALALALLAGATLLGALFVQWRLSSPAASPAPLASAPLQLATGQRAAAPPSAPAPVSFELTVQSAPAQATVSEDGRLLGVTPLVLVVDRKSVENGPRRFTLKREGYAPLTLEQGDSSTPVNASLVMVASRPSARTRLAASLPSAHGSLSAEVPLVRRNDAMLDIRTSR